MDLSVSQVAVAFDSADILNQILPADADQTIGFFNKLFAQTEVVERSGGEGTEVYGLNVSKTKDNINGCLLYTSPSPRDGLLSRMPSSA